MLLFNFIALSQSESSNFFLYVRRDQFNFLFYDPAELDFSKFEKKKDQLPEIDNKHLTLPLRFFLSYELEFATREFRAGNSTLRS